MTRLLSMKALALVAGASLCVASSAAPPLSGMRIAAVRDGKVCVSLDGGALHCFGSAASKARLPAWSRDGTRIAYIDQSDPGAALAWLVVTNPNGQPLSRLPIKPLALGEVRSGMRFVESLEWLDSDRVVASGTINPSSTESLVFDLGRGAVVAEYVDDGRGASFSPDGRHVLLVEGAPHFSGPGGRAPVLSLNGQAVLADLHADPGAVGPVRWSADGTRFALTARDAAGRRRLVVGHAQTKAARWVDLPSPPSDADPAPELFWSGHELHVQRLVPVEKRERATEAKGKAPGARPLSVDDQVLSSDPRDGTWKRADKPAANPFQAAARLRSATLGHSLPADVQDADLWCRACALDQIARRRGAAAD